MHNWGVYGITTKYAPDNLNSVWSIWLVLHLYFYSPFRWLSVVELPYNTMASNCTCMVVYIDTERSAFDAPTYCSTFIDLKGEEGMQ